MSTVRLSAARLAYASLPSSEFGDFNLLVFRTTWARAVAKRKIRLK